MTAFVNLAAYKFSPLAELPALRERLRAVAKSGDLRGTILLSPEGINLFVAGTREAATSLMAAVRAVPGLEDLTARESFSAGQPFGRMFVKIKREIIAFGVPGIDPARAPSPKVSARTLKQWLDEGRPVTLLDTRNDYEIQHGTFRGAVRAGIGRFRDFPAAAPRLAEQIGLNPVVMFCTGGIRCEKAGPFLEQSGFANVHQLEGGILKYFEECGDAHFEGRCFVFDQRVELDSSLQASGA